MIPDLYRDISITYAAVPSALDGVTARGVLWQVAPRGLLLDIPDVARYLVTAGNSITIEPAQDAAAQVVEHHLGMLPLAALLYQRGMLVFHAAAVANDQGVILLAGDSGSGKSTLIASLQRCGWQVLADDLTVVGLDELGLPVVYPTATGIALWPDSLEQLGISTDYLSSCDANRRIFVPVQQSVVGPLPLRGIYRMGVHSGGLVECEELAVNARFRAVGALVYNSHVADILCNKADYLRCAAAIAQSVRINILRRPRGMWSVEALVEQIVVSG